MSGNASGVRGNGTNIDGWVGQESGVRFPPVTAKERKKQVVNESFLYSSALTGGSASRCLSHRFVAQVESGLDHVLRRFREKPTADEGVVAERYHKFPSRITRRRRQ